MRIGIIALAIVILPCTRSVASELTTEHGYLIRNWDTEEGLPASNISALAKTPDGYLWIATSSGLVQYDGFRFKHFNIGRTSALSDSRVSSLLVDRAGVLWAGTFGGGLLRYTADGFQPVNLGTNLSRARAMLLTQDRSGAIWGIMERVGAFCYHDGQTRVYDTSNGLPSEMVWGIVVDFDDNVWLSLRGRLMRFHEGRWEDEGLPADFPRIYGLTPCKDGGLWLACLAQPGPPSGDRGARIFKYHKGNLTEDPCPLPCSQDSRRSLPRFLAEDRHGTVWCATRGAGIFFRDAKGWRLFSEAPSLSQVQAACILEDENSALWFGMDGSGLFQLRPRSVAVLEQPSGTPPSCFWTVHSGHDGSIWGGTDGNGIFRWRDGVMTHFHNEQGLLNTHVNAIIEDRKTNIWAGTMGGLFHLQNGRFELLAPTENLRLPVFSLKEDHIGRIWIGTRNGLVQITDSATNVFGQEQGIPFGPINAIEEDAAGRIWVGIPPFGGAGEYGLFVQSGKRFERFGAGKWAGEPNIRSLQADSSGNLWIGTIGTGFFRLHDGTFSEYSWADGVPHNRIQAIVPDDAGNLWFCSELGVFGCPARQLENHTRAQNARLGWWRIQRMDGLPNKSATGNGSPSATRDASGRVWFANGNALAGFDPTFVAATARLQPPVIEEIVVDGLPQSRAPKDRLRITSDTRRVEIHYSSPNTSSPNLPTFWTRLKGFDRDWVSGGATRMASYNLQPGNYEFAVAVTGPDGSRLETASPLAIEVVPHFWERTSVRVTAGVLFVAAIALGVWRWEKARSQRRLRELEIQRAMDQVRQRIARDIHDDLGSGLTEITLLSDNLRLDMRDPVDGKKTVERIAARARSLTHEMDEVVWAINPHTDTLEGLVTYLNDFAQERLALAGIRCRLNTATELPNMDLSADIRHNLYRAAKEALNNALKHAGASEVAITIEPRGSDIMVIIQDNGRGFDPAQQFKRGNGLKNMQQRLAEVGGSCVVQSQPGVGTSICFTVPATGRQFAISKNGHNGHNGHQS